MHRKSGLRCTSPAIRRPMAFRYALPRAFGS
jgi:hypothetical protein